MHVLIKDGSLILILHPQGRVLKKFKSKHLVASLKKAAGVFRLTAISFIDTIKTDEIHCWGLVKTGAYKNGE